MNTDRHNLPMRKTSSGEQIDTRPLYIEEWLDSLPYIDFQKTGQLLYKATLATNQQQVKPSVRLELVELYNRPYQYYLDSQIKTGAQHTPQSIETMQKQINALKRIAINLAYACKLAAEHEIKKKTLWRQSKPPLQAMLLSLNYLSHVLIFSYLKYSSTPKNVWQKLNFIYDFAAKLGKENAILPLPAGEPNHAMSTIAQAYKRIILASLCDPHHLPFGAIWEIFEQLHTWVNHVHITRFGTTDKPSGYFVVNLDSDLPPLPYIKFNPERATDKHCLIDAAGLSHVVEEKLTSINKGEGLNDTLKLSPHNAKIILGHLSKAWGLPPKRYFPREERKGILYLACGLNAVYFFINKETEFISGQTDSSRDIILEESESKGIDEAITSSNYKLEQWELVDQGPGGIAAVRTAGPSYNVRIGDLVAININGEEKKWNVGVIRWMMVHQTNNYKLGIQLISKATLPAAVRACSGSVLDSQFRRALLLMNGEDLSIITGKGLFMENRELEIKSQNKIFKATATTMKESTPGFEYFNIRR